VADFGIRRVESSGCGVTVLAKATAKDVPLHAVKELGGEEV
jgi:hypothetical protein